MSFYHTERRAQRTIQTTELTTEAFVKLIAALGPYSELIVTTQASRDHQHEWQGYVTLSENEDYFNVDPMTGSGTRFTMIPVGDIIAVSLA